MYFWNRPSVVCKGAFLNYVDKIFCWRSILTTLRILVLLELSQQPDCLVTAWQLLEYSALNWRQTYLSWHLWRYSLTVCIWENLQTVDISNITYLPCFVNVVCERPRAQCISDAVIKCCFRYEKKMRSMHLVQFWKRILNFLHFIISFSSSNT